jgi:hypothetical protein
LALLKTNEPYDVTVMNFDAWFGSLGFESRPQTWLKQRVSLVFLSTHRNPADLVLHYNNFIAVAVQIINYNIIQATRLRKSGALMTSYLAKNVQRIPYLNF